MKTRLLRLPGWWRRLTGQGPAVLSEIMYALATWAPPALVEAEGLTVAIHFDTPEIPGLYVIELDREGVRYLHRELAEALRRDSMPPAPPPVTH